MLRLITDTRTLRSVLSIPVDVGKTELKAIEHTEIFTQKPSRVNVRAVLQVHDFLSDSLNCSIVKRSRSLLVFASRQGRQLYTHTQTQLYRWLHTLSRLHEILNNRPRHRNSADSGKHHKDCLQHILCTFNCLQMTDCCQSRYGGYSAMNTPGFRDSRRCCQPPLPPLRCEPPDETDDRNDFRFESARRRSFANWPVRFMDPKRLAEAGFYYLNEGDKVRCFECKIEICKWVEGDDPQFEHQRWSERCRFVRRLPCGNVPYGTDGANIFSAPRTTDVCGPYGFNVESELGPNLSSSPPNLQHTVSTATLGSWGIGMPKEPKHPQYVSRDARLRTFNFWPKSMRQTKEELADAGFFYTGKGDQTLCYYCGGGLKDWEPTDNAWEQHAHWFSKCFYLFMVKGQAFIDQVKGLTREQPSAEEAQNLTLPNCIKKVERPIEAEPEEHCPIAETGESGESCSKSGSLELGPHKSEGSMHHNLENDEKRADDGRLCKICYTEELGVVFLPCGHMVACVKCAPSLTTCAVCRKPFTMTVRAYIS
ncbi:death-associated inhibitor of apoptosis 1 isoform X1 [Neodiprion lecontei]|uniref:Death-associated inhibitor of apoptosis 1 isoform X1 n=2 Tax=Neodiprion lecontei TaxID=441921 RepID=A0ABM3GME8_NEOLC|nr:death-associated inhibitor of apoptosis 1 isoform X1 [Neodiprion lecontei]